MNDTKATKYLLCALMVICTATALWTMNYICATGNFEIPETVTALKR